MAKKVKNANLEWFRIISMVMVVILHTLDKGNLLRDIFRDGGEYVGNINVPIAWLLESFAIVAVNIFFLISGYLLIDSEFKTKRIFSLVMEVTFYGAVIYLLSGFLPLGAKEGTNYEFLQCFMPIHMDTYWFMSVYVLVYLMLPFIKIGVKAMNQKQHLTVIVIWTLMESVLKSVLPVKLEIDRGGYNIQWFIILILISSYIKKYGFKILNKAYKGMLLYLAGVLLIFGENFVLSYLLAKYVKFTYIQGISFAYNHIFVLMASIGLFAFALNKKEPGKVMSKIAVSLAPMSLGVYLIHEHVLIRYEWPKWLKVSSYIKGNTFVFILSVLGAAIIVYAAGTVIDFVRLQLFRLVDLIFKKSIITKGFNRLDDLVNGKVD